MERQTKGESDRIVECSCTPLEAYAHCAMRSCSLVFLMSATAWPMTGSAKTSAHQPCVITYSIIERDTLGNVNQGESGKTLKWLTDDLERKYPGVCYAPPSPNVRTVLLITVVPAVYNGTRLVTNSADTTGHISDNDGNSATYNGTTTSTTAVPYSNPAPGDGVLGAPFGVHQQ